MIRKATYRKGEDVWVLGRACEDISNAGPAGRVQVGYGEKVTVDHGMVMGRSESDPDPDSVYAPPATEPREAVPIAQTGRGFLRGADLQSMYGGKICVYESSGIEPGIWVKVIDSSGGVLLSVQALALLSLESAATLRDQLDHLIEHHWTGKQEADDADT